MVKHEHRCLYARSRVLRRRCPPWLVANPRRRPAGGRFLSVASMTSALLRPRALTRISQKMSYHPAFEGQQHWPICKSRLILQGETATCRPYGRMRNHNFTTRQIRWQQRFGRDCNAIPAPAASTQGQCSPGRCRTPLTRCQIACERAGDADRHAAVETPARHGGRPSSMASRKPVSTDPRRANSNVESFALLGSRLSGF